MSELTAPWILSTRKAAAAPATGKPTAEQNGQARLSNGTSASASATEPTEAERNAIIAAEKEFANLREAQQAWATASLAANKKANRDNAAATKEETQKYLDLQIKDLKG